MSLHRVGSLSDLSLPLRLVNGGVEVYPAHHGVRLVLAPERHKPLFLALVVAVDLA